MTIKYLKKSPKTSSPKNNTNVTGDVSILHIARKNSKSNILKKTSNKLVKAFLGNNLILHYNYLVLLLQR